MDPLARLEKLLDFYLAELQESGASSSRDLTPWKLYPSTQGKLYMIAVPRKDGSTKVVHFGQKGAEQYPVHKDPERKRRYLERHSRPHPDGSPREFWDDPYTAGFWSRWVLWNKLSIPASLKEAVAKAKKHLQ